MEAGELGQGRDVFGNGAFRDFPASIPLPSSAVDLAESQSVTSLWQITR